MEFVEHASNVGFKKGILPVEINQKEEKIFIYTFAGHKANALLSSIFSLDYDIYNVNDTPYYSSFKTRQDISREDISKVINNVPEILRQPEINSLIDEKTEKFVKNKFINYLPYDDNIKLKMELLYNPEDLFKVLNGNSVIFVESSEFKDW